MSSTVKSTDLPDILKLFAHELRWSLLALLAHSDFRVQELVARVGRPMNLVSYHLAQLRKGELVVEHRSSADARDVYYSLDLQKLAALYATAGAALHPFLVRRTDEPHGDAPPTGQCRVLFLCTHNSARSQMAEALLRHAGGGWVQAFSAGAEPAGVHPLALETMAGLGIDMSSQRSKGFDEFLGQRFDAIITVCDRVREQCPVFPGDPQRIHWSIADPAAVQGDGEAQRAAFATTAQLLAGRVGPLLAALADEALI
jgi:protein-tyrosine-phosphatase/DNA-binding transcriptional ArsR family regulator